MLTLGFAGALRRSELFGLDWEAKGDSTGCLSRDEHGRGVLVKLLCSKGLLSARSVFQASSCRASSARALPEAFPHRHHALGRQNVSQVQGVDEQGKHL